MYAQYGIELLGLKKKTEKKHKKKLLPKTEIWCLVKRCAPMDMMRLDIFRILVIVENTLIHRYGSIREPVIYVLADFVR